MNDPSTTEFDEVYYKKLMDGLEAIEIKLSVCKDIIDFRIDASTYKKEYVRTDKILKSLNIYSIEDKMKSIQNFGAYSLCNDIVFTDDGEPFLMTQNIRHNYIDWNNIRYIDEKSHKMLYKSHCKKGQVLVTMAGEYLGRVAVYDQDSICSSNQAIAKITLEDGISPYYVATFLNSRYGQNQINRLKTVTGQPNINMALIKSLKVPLFSNHFNKVIESIVMHSNEMLRQANVFYHKAEKLLKETLGFKDFDFQTEKYSIKSFKNSYRDTGRLDAEFYQEKYDIIERILRNYDKGIKRLDDVAEYIFTGEYAEEYFDYRQGRKYYIRGTDIWRGFVEKNDEYCIEPKYYSKFVKRGDIVTGRVGTIGNFGIIDEDLDGSVCSDNILCFHLPENYVPEVYALYFNLTFIKELITRLARGSVQQRLNQETLRDILVPSIDEGIQEKLRNVINKSREMELEAKKILDKVDLIVEVAIEQGEDAVLKYKLERNLL